MQEKWQGTRKQSMPKLSHDLADSVERKRNGGGTKNKQK